VGTHDPRSHSAIFGKNLAQELIFSRGRFCDGGASPPARFAAQHPFESAEEQMQILIPDPQEHSASGVQH